MFTNMTPLRFADHATLRVSPLMDYEFARSLLLAPIVLDEIADVGREYPIVFPVNANVPAALLGIEKDRNAYVGSDGAWRAKYIPAHIRRYPFMLAPLPKKEDGAEGFALMIDMDSPLVSKKKGIKLFAKDETLSENLQPIMRIMELMQQRQPITQALVGAIDQAGLLIERQLLIKAANGTEQRISGLRMIDEKKLNELDDPAFNTLRRSGALPLVYAHLLSWANLRNGPLAEQRVPVDDAANHEPNALKD